jgi:RHS repeat-associated protein
VITEDKVTTTGGTNVTTILFDSLGRQVETQTATIAGTASGRAIADTYCNSDGWVSLTSSPYYTSGAPSSQLYLASASNVPSQTGYVYDGAGRVIKKILYKYGTATRETDTAYGGDYVTVTPPAGGTAQTTYTDGRGLITYIYKYHSNPPPSSPPAPGAGYQSGASGWDQTSYSYDPAGQLTGITDAAGSQWGYGYDLAGNQTSQTTPDAGTTASTYDNDNLLTSVTDNAGNTVSYTYDAASRITGKYASALSGHSAANQLDSWAYDSLGKGLPVSATSYTNGNVKGQPYYTEGVTSYNSYELPTGHQTVIGTGPLAGTYQQNLAYTPYGNLVSGYYDYGAGGLPSENVALSYDTASRPTSLTSNWQTYVADLAYTGIGQPQEYALGTTATPAWLELSYYPDTGLPQTQTVLAGTSSGNVDTTSYTYDAAGNLTSEADTPASGPAQVQCFQYDSQDRLSQAWAQGTAACASSPAQAAEAGAAAGYWNSYTYDITGNLTKEVATPPSGSATTYTSDFPGPVTGSTATLPHAIGKQTAAGPGATTTTNFGYTANGQASSIDGPNGSQTLTWGGTNRDPAQLTAITKGTSTTSYVYDAAGNLLLQNDSGTLTLYLSDEEITCTVSSAGACASQSGVRYYTIGGLTIAARTSAGQVQYLFGDRQGTANLAIDASSLAVTRRWYNPDGQLLDKPPPWPGNRGFVGGTADPATALDNLGAREYNPGTASFISPDPILNPYNPADLNPYAYAYDNPATGSDPSGLYLPSEGGGCPSSEAGCPGYSGGAAASGEPAAVRQAYNGYLGVTAGGYAIQPWMQWKALSLACASTGACGPGVSAQAGYQYTLTWSQARRQQLAGPKPPLWEALAEIYGGTAAGAALAELAGPGYDAAYALSVQTSAWWLTLSAGATATALTSTENDAPEAVNAGAAAADPAAASASTGGPIAFRWSVDGTSFTATRTADGAWQMSSGVIRGASPAANLPTSYASLADPGSSLAEVLTENEDDIAKAVTEYSGDIHYFAPGVPAVSDPVAACAVTVACLAAGVWRHFFGG